MARTGGHLHTVHAHARNARPPGSQEIEPLDELVSGKQQRVRDVSTEMEELHKAGAITVGVGAFVCECLFVRGCWAAGGQGAPSLAPSPPPHPPTTRPPRPPSVRVVVVATPSRPPAPTPPHPPLHTHPSLTHTPHPTRAQTMKDTDTSSKARAVLPDSYFKATETLGKHYVMCSQVGARVCGRAWRAWLLVCGQAQKPTSPSRAPLPAAASSTTRPPPPPPPVHHHAPPPSTTPPPPQTPPLQQHASKGKTKRARSLKNLSTPWHQTFKFGKEALERVPQRVVDR